MDTAKLAEIENTLANFRSWLTEADLDTVRMVRYATEGMGNRALRDLRWVMGRKAGRVHVEMGA